MKQHELYMREALCLAEESVREGGGPFGAVIVRDGEIIAASANSVTLTHDPTAHAEVNAIRLACANLQTHNLSGCVIYTSCEPCPMCLGAIYWARLGAIYYANTRTDAQAIGFDDSFIYDEIARPLEQRKIPMTQLLRQEGLEAFEEWRLKADKSEY
ncbi:MAG: nucleoside deaminase [Chloroflexi bacterium]|uniref:Nucleoside deaminase n=1 Tax=Candidatus Chlorohelix allophototropha TaxID=3003348 RepID=A0A8T7M9F0_9CHLR|nr:nucleoside deaminase [Chloroflexota bacterium]WJW68714.1 nucleoside deaminase [Chloroflexota bacterium L227-S17]